MLFTHNVIHTQVEVDEQQVAVLSPGEYFGEGALLTTNPRRASIIATEATVVSWLDRNAFRSLLGEQLVETLQVFLFLLDWPLYMHSV
jgi:CRP-like cAMP-binding protein